MKKLNIYWYSDKKRYMNACLSGNWFDHYFENAKAFCESSNLSFKVILFLDNVPGHVKFLVGRHPNVHVCFLLPNTTSKFSH